MRIVHIAAEFSPIAKAGGLGEVLLGLTRETTKQGHLVETILPKYDLIDLSYLSDVKLDTPHFKCLEHQNAMWSAQYEECKLHLLDSRHPAGFFHRGKIYGCEDDIARFTYFSRAALEYLALNPQPIDVLHLHDWHVSLCAPMVRNLFTQLSVKAIVLTIHNLEYQGKCAVQDLDRVGLQGEFYLKPNLLQDDHPKYPQSINLLKGGIVFSDAVVPVSPSYAEEILTPDYGAGLDKTLYTLKSKIHGILNGIDTTHWNPAKDAALAEGYSLHSASQGKDAARTRFKLDTTKRPWIGAVTRLVPQKGPELLEAALEKTIEWGGSFILLGSSPIPALQEHFNKLRIKYRGHPQVFLQYEYNENLAHQIYAALDLLLVPSHIEPCGLTQMIGMRYGTVPIVRATGGLKDTVFDHNDLLVPSSQRNGFSFLQPSPESMTRALSRAFHLFRSDPKAFATLQKRGMESDFSWAQPMQRYLSLYRELLKGALDVHPVRIDIVADRNDRVESRDRHGKKTNLLK